MDKNQQGGARKKKKEEGDRDTKTTVTIPYVKGVLEALSWVFRHHGVVTAMKPHLTLRHHGVVTAMKPHLPPSWCSDGHETPPAAIMVQ